MAIRELQYELNLNLSLIQSNWEKAYCVSPSIFGFSWLEKKTDFLLLANIVVASYPSALTAIGESFWCLRLYVLVCEAPLPKAKLDKP